MAKEIVRPATPFQLGGGRILPSPNQFYLTGEDSLRIVSANSLVGVAIKIQVRTANLAGDTIPHSFTHTPFTDRSINREDYPVGTGSILNVTVFAGAGAPLVGQTFVIIQLVRGTGAAAVVLGTLLAGYITATQALGFPGSPIRMSTEGDGFVRQIIGSNPVGGVEIVETVPTGARWEVLSIVLVLSTNTVIVNRFLALTMAQPGGVGALLFNTVAQPANTSGIYTFAPNLSVNADAARAYYTTPLPAGHVLLAGGSWATTTLNLTVGDNFTVNRYLVREWLEVP